MVNRFKGNDGKKALIDALLQQKVVQHDRTIAAALAAKGKVVSFESGKDFIVQNDDDNDVFFILDGEAAVVVNTQKVGLRRAKEVVGEMAAIDPAARRSATIRATKPVTALKISAKNFLDAGGKSIPFWRMIAQMTGDRLRDRSKFHLPANDGPVLFGGSSVEGLRVLDELHAQFKHGDISFRPWKTDIFGASQTAIDDLMKEVVLADFAVFVFGPDDKIKSRGSTKDAPRDNVIFEMGLFVGRLGKDRVYMVKEAKSDLKIPSDLIGTQPITYVCKNNCTLGQALGPAVLEIRKAIEQHGVLQHRLAYPT